MKKNYMAKFLSALLIFCFVFTSAVFADVSDETETDPHSEYTESLYNYWQAVIEYEKMKADGSGDRDELLAKYSKLNDEYKNLLKAYIGFKIEECELKNEYTAAMKEYTEKKEAYNNFNWYGYTTAKEQYENDKSDYEERVGNTKKIKNESSDAKTGEVAYYSTPIIIKNADSLNKFKGKEITEGSRNVSIGRGVTLSFIGSSIIVKSDGNLKGLGLYDIYFISNDTVYYILVEIKVEGVFVIPLKDSKDKDFDIQDMVVNRNTADMMNNPPDDSVLKVQLPENPGNEPEVPDLSEWENLIAPWKPSKP